MPRHMPTPIIVIKVGGSLVRTGRHCAVLHVLARATRSVVIVPGGGALADEVRTAQRLDGFSDAVAHDKALAAMTATGEVMAALSPKFIVSRTMTDIRSALSSGHVPVWSPEQMMALDTTLPSDWSVTSDALAARLAELIGNARCLLVKSQRVAPGWSWQALARRGVVDPWFPKVVRRSGLRADVRGAMQLGQLARDVDALAVAC